MGARGVTLLCTGDIHLGRHPSRVPTDVSELTVSHIWEKIVDLAIDRDVDLVALTGDIIDRENRYFEALGPLENGLHRLAARGISTFAVAGNHDYDVLTRLEDSEHFRLLGRGGRWERVVFKRDDIPVLQILGWSFPSRHVAKSPLSTLERDLDLLEHRDIPAVGLLHADLDSSQSRYAPVSTSELAASPVAIWLLGHIHRPMSRSSADGGLVLYPGSPQPLDPGETGVHGPWIVEVGAESRVDAYQVPLATVRYHELDIDLKDVDEKAEFDRAVPAQIRAHLEELAGESDHLRRVIHRLRYRGRTALHRKLEEFSGPLIEDLGILFEGISSDVDGVQVATAPKLDLEELAGETDPPAVLAKFLLELREDRLSEEGKLFFDNLRGRLDKIHGSGAYAPLLSDEATSTTADDEWVRDEALATGLSLLDEMIAAKQQGTA